MQNVNKEHAGKAPEVSRQAWFQKDRQEGAALTLRFVLCSVLFVGCKTMAGVQTPNSARRGRGYFQKELEMGRGMNESLRS